MTVKSTIAAIRALSPILNVRHQDGEYRVSIQVSAIFSANPQAGHQGAKDRSEALAYYTNDAEDAVATAKHILAQWQGVQDRRARRASSPLEVLKDKVTGAIERGEAEAIVAVEAPEVLPAPSSDFWSSHLTPNEAKAQLVATRESLLALADNMAHLPGVAGDLRRAASDLFAAWSKARSLGAEQALLAVEAR